MIDIVATSGALGQIGFQAVLTYDPAQLEYVSFEPKDLFAAGVSLPGAPPNGEVTINVAILGGTAAADAGSMGQATFTVLSGFSGETSVKLKSGKYDTTPVEIGGGGASVTIGGAGVIPTDPVAASDFSGDGEVDFGDFLTFAAAFGKKAGDADFNSRIDLDQDGEVGFTDFLAFARQFGKSVGG